MIIRAEQQHDQTAIHAVNSAAFQSVSEANLVDALREQASPLISLVAEEQGTVVGHILFSPVSLSGHPTLEIMGLAPMAIVPEQQRKGFGSALVRAGLEECRQSGFGAVVVLGHPEFYPRFGFRTAAKSGLNCEYEAPEEAFMLLELQPGYLQSASGTIHYHAAFKSL